MSELGLLLEGLKACGQNNLIKLCENLPDSEKASLIEQLQEVPWNEIAHESDIPEIGTFARPNLLTLNEREKLLDELQQLGENSFRAGKVAVILVAGGQGTRLGYEGPKGCFKLMPLSGKSIFQIHAEKILAACRKYATEIPFLIMTSPQNDQATQDYFKEHHFFGLRQEQVHFFQQGTAITLDQNGEALFSGPKTLLQSPDGHGGCLQALNKAGLLTMLSERDVEYLCYLQVDNVLAPVDDTFAIGIAEKQNLDAITKVVAKANPEERVGCLVQCDGKDRIVEYTEVTPEQTKQTNSAGQLIFNYGNTAMHVWRVQFLKDLADKNQWPAYHRSKKPVSAWVDGEEKTVEAIKLERFIFDLIQLTDKSIGLEVARTEEFAPVKNAEGQDSPATAVALSHNLFAQWLEAAGTRVSSGTSIEISPLYAATQTDFLKRWDKSNLEVPNQFYLDE